MTTQLTTESFKLRVKKLVEDFSKAKKGKYPGVTPPAVAPEVTCLLPEDTEITPFNISPSLIVTTSSWIDLCSPDPVIADVSAQVLRTELAYASFVGLTTVIIKGPTFRNGVSSSAGTAQFANVLLDTLKLASYLHIYIWLPMTGLSVVDPDDSDDDVLQSVSISSLSIDDQPVYRGDDFDSWDVWNVIRTTCEYSARLGVGELLRLL
jgi:protein arginine N-methyltransferase 5